MMPFCFIFFIIILLNNLVVQFTAFNVGSGWISSYRKGKTQRTIHHHVSRMQQKYDDENANADEEDAPTSNTDIDSLRQILESCWNSDTMGSIPTNAESAAESASGSIQNAIDSDDVVKKIFFVDLLLPQYDITQGSKIYDEVLVIEFCVALCKQLHRGKSNIIVRDDTILKTVSRIFNAREGRDVTASTLPTNTKKETRNGNDQNFSPKLDTNQSSQTSDSYPQLSSQKIVEFYDDFADFGLVGESVVDNESTLTAETFQNKLISKVEGIDNRNEVLASGTGCYRLSSMLGNATISRGPDMMDDVLMAVSANAKPTDDEETIIIVSAVTKEEMIGIRGLAGKYGGTKTIVLVNCQIETLPRELIGAQTVYSILPLIARPKASTTSSSIKSDPDAPKVVVMRRFPRDWEVYIDIDEEGFELAASVPASSVDRKKGPSVEWITRVVEKYLESR